MKKKNVFRTAALLAVASVGFAGCSKDDDVPASSSVKGTIKEAVTLPSGVTVDKVEVYDTDDWEKPDVAWKDGSLTITLPETVTQEGLRENYKGLPEGISVSNSTVKSAEWGGRIWAFNGNQEVGYFYYATAPKTGNGIDYSTDGTYTDKEEEGSFVYVDGDVTITGGYTDEDVEYEYVGEGNGDYEYDYEKDEYVPTEGGRFIFSYPVTISTTASISFKKGWNIQSMSGIREITVKGGKIVASKVTVTISSSASGAKWYFYDSKNSYNSPAQAAKISKLRKLSKLSK